jgi:hypothetical protein
LVVVLLQVYVHPSVLQPTPGSLSFGLREYIEQRLPGEQMGAQCFATRSFNSL